MARLLFNGKCYSSKEAILMFNNGNYSYSSAEMQPIYPIDPNALDVIGNASGYGSASPFGYIEKHQSVTYSITQRNSEYVFYMLPQANTCIGVTQKIPKSCKTIEVEGEVVGYTGDYQTASIAICGTPVPATYTSPNDVKHRLYFANYNTTTDAINSQEYITFEIPCTAINIMARQKVTIDVASMNLTDDFYVVFHNCDTHVYIRSVKCIF